MVWLPLCWILQQYFIALQRDAICYIISQHIAGQALLPGRLSMSGACCSHAAAAGMKQDCVSHQVEQPHPFLPACHVVR